VLQRALAGIEVHSDQNVLIGYENADDAGVYLIDDENALVQSVDFFTPIVDDPYVYGAIAATNSVSDIYAMGAVPKLALSLVEFPSKTLEEKVLHEILSGGNEAMKQAGVVIVGGHSVEATELKFGYCVTGFMKPEKLYANSTAQPGDVLILTKPIGTGIIATGIKAKKTPPIVEKKAIEWMLKLNTPAVNFFHKHSVHAVTDITGYGLIGHAFELARASRVTLSIHAGKVPLMTGVEELAEAGLAPKAIETNRHYVEAGVSWNAASEFHQQMLLDPQTSGGLLVSLPKEAAEGLGQSLENEGFVGQPIGDVRLLDGSYVRVE
jgi:selenium donor protein